MPKLNIIDPHHHLWSLRDDKYPWLRKPMHVGVYGNLESISADYLLKDYQEDTKNYNLLASVHIEADYDRRFPVEETAWLAKLYAEEEGAPSAIVGYAALEDPKVDEVLEGHLEYGDMFKAFGRSYAATKIRRIALSSATI